MNVYNTTSGNLTSTLTINPGDRVGIDDTLSDRLTTYNPTTGLFSGYALPDGTLASARLAQQVSIKSRLKA